MAENVRVQYGALPYRWNDAGDLEVLLITSRRSRRWIVPKGWPIKGRKPWETAAIEAREEAGISGKVAVKPVGRFYYDKVLDENGRSLPCEVTVFPLLVKRQLKKWREQKQRDAGWLSVAQAASLAADEGLRAIIAGFAPSQDGTAFAG